MLLPPQSVAFPKVVLVKVTGWLPGPPDIMEVELTILLSAKIPIFCEKGLEVERPLKMTAFWIARLFATVTLSLTPILSAGVLL